MNYPGNSLTLDRATAEILVARLIAPPDAPRPYVQVAAALAAFAAPGDVSEAAAREAGIRLAAAAKDPESRLRFPHPVRSLRSSFRYKLAVIGMTGFLVLTGGLAAAGALPDGMQGVARNVLRKVGIHVPGPNPNAGSHPFERGKSGKTKEHIPGQPAKPSKNPHSKFGPSVGGTP